MSTQVGAAPPPLLCQLRIPKGMCNAEIEKLYKDIQTWRGIYPKVKSHDRKRSFRDISDAERSMKNDVGSLHTSIPLRLLQQRRQTHNLEMKSRIRNQQAGKIEQEYSMHKKGNDNFIC